MRVLQILLHSFGKLIPIALVAPSMVLHLFAKKYFIFGYLHQAKLL